jgi:hypothetical protein
MSAAQWHDTLLEHAITLRLNGSNLMRCGSLPAATLACAKSQWPHKHWHEKHGERCGST